MVHLSDALAPSQEYGTLIGVWYNRYITREIAA